MKNVLLILTLVILGICSCREENKSGIGAAPIETKTKESTIIKSKLLTQNQDLEPYIYTDTTYIFSIGGEVTLLNSFPKGGSITPEGMQYLDGSGKRYGYATFWTQIINKSNTPLEVNICFPTDSLTFFGSPNSYSKLFLPTESWTIDKLSSFNYGLTAVKSFLDNNFNKTQQLKKKLIQMRSLRFML